MDSTIANYPTATGSDTVASDCSSRLTGTELPFQRTRTSAPELNFFRLFFQKIWQHRTPSIILGAVMIAVGIAVVFMDLAFLGIPTVFAAPIAYGLIFGGGTLIAKGLYDGAELSAAHIKQSKSEREVTLVLAPEDLPQNHPGISPQEHLGFSENILRQSPPRSADIAPPRPEWIRTFMQKLCCHRNMSVVLGLTLIIIGVGLVFLDLAALGVSVVLTAPLTHGLFSVGGTLVLKGFYDCAGMAVTQSRKAL